jgi:hypothetical protein
MTYRRLLALGLLPSRSLLLRRCWCPAAAGLEFSDGDARIPERVLRLAQSPWLRVRGSNQARRRSFGVTSGTGSLIDNPAPAASAFEADGPDGAVLLSVTYLYAGPAPWFFGHIRLPGLFSAARASDDPIATD